MEIRLDQTTIPITETAKSRLNDQTLENGILVKNLAYGINLYKSAIKKEDCVSLINDLENEISLGIPGIQWSASRNRNHSRDCFDFQFKKEDLGKTIPASEALEKVYDLIDNSLDKCLSHYEVLWGLTMEYKESFGFVKYLPGGYFKEHTDSGEVYSCTLSIIVYLNDGYDGGELEFVRQGLFIKPEAGDVVIAPASYLYRHAALELISGIKYAVLIMTDYNDFHHKENGGLRCPNPDKYLKT